MVGPDQKLSFVYDETAAEAMLAGKGKLQKLSPRQGQRRSA